MKTEGKPKIGDFVILKGTMQTGYVWHIYYRTGLLYIYHPMRSEINIIHIEQAEVLVPWEETVKFHEKYIDKYLKKEGLKND